MNPNMHILLFACLFVSAVMCLPSSSSAAFAESDEDPGNFLGGNTGESPQGSLPDFANNVPFNTISSFCSSSYDSSSPDDES